MRDVSWGVMSLYQTHPVLSSPFFIAGNYWSIEINILQPWTPCDSPIMCSFWQDGGNYWGGQQPRPTDRFPDTAIPTALKRHWLHPLHRNAILWCHLVVIDTIEIMKWSQGLVGVERQTLPLLLLPAQPDPAQRELAGDWNHTRSHGAINSPF